jgi:ferrous iron transport protein B
LTGLRQKVGNFPGVTVERKNGILKINDETEASIVDLPGTYSLFPTSIDERIVLNVLCNINDKDYPDVIVYIADINNLERHTLLLTQIIDLQFPIVLVLNMNDIAIAKGISVNSKKLSALFDIPIVYVNGRTGTGIESLKEEINQLFLFKKTSSKNFYSLTDEENEIAGKILEITNVKSKNTALLVAHQYKKIPFLTSVQKEKTESVLKANNFNAIDNQLNEIMERYNRFVPIINQTLEKQIAAGNSITDKIDRFVTHRFLGPILFFTIMLVVFQSIFSLSSIPMDFIDQQFSNLSTYIQQHFSVNLISRLLSEGIIPGISGVLIFVPQIFILFLLISTLEEVGYMSRAVFMFDKIMQRFGLNGRSLVSLISGGACAIPAIMSTRTISNWKERLITIMVTPLISSKI